MWLFTKYGFYSITKAELTRKKELFQVRARARKDLINLKNAIPSLRFKKIHIYPYADYRFRIYVWKLEMVEILLELGESLDYSNFKNKITGIENQKDKYNYYNKVWGVMYGYQRVGDEKDQFKLAEELYGKQLSIGYTGGLDEVSEHKSSGSKDIPELREEYLEESDINEGEIREIY
jgi:hypothetical protein